MHTHTHGEANSCFSYTLQTHLKTKICLTKFQCVEVLNYEVVFLREMDILFDLPSPHRPLCKKIKWIIRCEIIISGM